MNYENTTLQATQQLELGLDRRATRRHARRQPERISRAEWWFNEMRRVVNEVLDWSPTPSAPPEQTWLLPARRSRTS